MVRHFRNEHPDLCESDGSCPQYGILPKGTNRLKKPTKYRKITDAEWYFLKNSIPRAFYKYSQSAWTKL